MQRVNRRTVALTVLAALAGLTLAMTAGSVGFDVMARDVGSLYSSLAWLSFLVVGVVILRSRPRNTVGWCFLVSALLLAANGLGDEGLTVGAPRSWPDPLLHLFAVLTGVSWFPGLFLLITVALLHFPDGLLSPRWRWVSYAAVALLSIWSALFGVLLWFVPVSQIVSDETPHLTGLRGVLVYTALGCIPAMVPVVIAVIVSLVLRYRRSDGVHRQQIRWVAAAGSLAVVVEIGLDLVGSVAKDVSDSLQSLVEPTAFGLIAVATGIAITRYKLYEIDRLVSRSVSYLVISAVLVGVYAAVVSVTALVIPDRYGSAGVAVATLAAVALFVPLRSRVQHVVDRRFDRSRYDTDVMVGSFATALREDLSLDGVHEELLRAVRRSVAPATATIWLAPTEES